MLVAGIALAGSVRAVSPLQLVEVTDFGGVTVSADGIRVGFRTERASIERDTYDSDWYVQRLDGASPPLRVASGGVPLRDSAGLALPPQSTWSADGRWLYFLASVDGEVDIWRAAVDGSGARRLTHDAADVRSFVLREDGRSLAFSVGAARARIARLEEAERDEGVRIDERVPIGQPLFRSGRVDGRPATQRLGEWFNREPLLADVADRWKVLDLDTTSVRDMTPREDPPAAPDVGGPAPVSQGRERWKVVQDREGGRIAILTRIGDAGRLRYRPGVELSATNVGTSGVPIVCALPGCTEAPITEVLWRPGHDEVIFTVTPYDTGFAQSIRGWNVNTGAVRTIHDADGLVGGGGRWAFGTCDASTEALACVTSEAGVPSRLERIDLETGERRTLFDPNHALAGWLHEGAAPTLLRWSDGSGRSFTGQYMRADDGRGVAPLFVTYYNCAGFLRGASGDEWPLASLAASGISVLCINALPFDLDAEARYGAGQSAIESAVALLRDRGEVDAGRVGMGGFSFAAETAFWTAIHSDVLTAISVATPVVSGQYLLLGSNRGSQFAEGLQKFWQLATPEASPGQWRKLSPALNLDRIDVPLLMQMPEQEFLQSLDYAIPMMRAHRADVYVFPAAPHIKFSPRQKLAAYRRNLDWFRFWLQDIEDADAGKAAQYASWRHMREAMAARRADRAQAGISP